MEGDDIEEAMPSAKGDGGGVKPPRRIKFMKLPGNGTSGEDKGIGDGDDRQPGDDRGTSLMDIPDTLSLTGEGLRELGVTVSRIEAFLGKKGAHAGNALEAKADLLEGIDRGAPSLEPGVPELGCTWGDPSM